jgi:hypothetical protein
VFCTYACAGLEPYFGTLTDEAGDDDAAPDDDGVDTTLVSTH